MEQPPAETVDQTLHTSVERVRTSREIIRHLDERLARGSELLDPSTPRLTDLPKDDPPES